jgi:hypothetical protein
LRPGSGTDRAALYPRLLSKAPLLRELIIREHANGLDLANNVEIIVATNSYRAVRGRTVLCAILDECAFYRDEDFASSDKELYAALAPGLATLPGAMLIGISTPHKRSGLLYEKWRDHYGQDDDDVLVIRAPSLVLNPTLDKAIIDDALARDPQLASAEWLAEWRSDISGFLDLFGSSGLRHWRPASCRRAMASFTTASSILPAGDTMPSPWPSRIKKRTA